MTTAAQMRDEFAVVTGASTGIGAAITERLAASGMHLVLVARSADKLDEVAARLSRRHGVTVRALPVDLATTDAPARLAKALADEGIEVEMLVDNASTGGYIPAPYLAVYAATKAYVVSFTQALWAETHGTGVRSAEAVATTVLRALSGSGPAVIDGKANALITFLFGRLLPTRFSLAVARRRLGLSSPISSAASSRSWGTWPVLAERPEGLGVASSIADGVVLAEDKRVPIDAPARLDNVWSSVLMSTCGGAAVAGISTTQFGVESLHLRQTPVISGAHPRRHRRRISAIGCPARHSSAGSVAAPEIEGDAKEWFLDHGWLP